MSKIIVRDAVLDDESEVQNLCFRNGLKREKSKNAWGWIWGKNRFYNSDWTLGWVLETDEKIVGFIGNIPRCYTFKGKELLAGVARAFVVDEKYRSHSLKLIAKFFKQANADVLIFSSANQDAATIYSFAGADKIPQSDYNKDLFWIISPIAFIFSLLRKKGVSSKISSLISWLIGPLLLIEKKLRNRWKSIKSHKIEIITLDKLAVDINQLWSYTQRTNPEKLLALRDREAIEWQFINQSAIQRKPIVFAIYMHEKLYGYVIAMQKHSPEVALKRIVITDIMVRDNDHALINDLVKAVYFYAEENKMAMVQLTGFPKDIRLALNKLHPFKHSVVHDRFLYFTKRSDLKSDLAQEKIWYASTFDGDSSI